MNVSLLMTISYRVEPLPKYVLTKEEMQSLYVHYSAYDVMGFDRADGMGANSIDTISPTYYSVVLCRLGLQICAECSI